MPYTSTYVRQPNAPRQPYQRNSRLIDIALRGSEIEADAIRRQGENSAQMWGNVGNQIGSSLSQIANYQADAPKREREAMQNENLKMQTEAIKRDRKDTATAKAIVPMALVEDENGVYTYDRNLLTKEFTTAGMADRLPELFSGLDHADKAVIDLESARTEALAGIAYSLHSSGNSPEAFQLAMKKAIKNRLITPAEAGPYIEAAQADPSRIGELTKTLASQSLKFAEKFAPPKVGTREIKRKNADGSETIDIVEDKPGQSFTSAADPAAIDAKKAFFAARAKESGVPLPAVTSTTLAKWEREWNTLNDQPAKPDLVQVSEIDPATGEIVTSLVPRKPGEVARKTAPTTDGERTAASFFTQMEKSIKIIDELEDKLTETELYQIQSLPQEKLVGLINRGQLSEDAKRYLRAFTQFTEARLRSVSGAAINDAEYARDRQVYARQFGETPQLATDRREARGSALESLGRKAGNARPKADTTTSDTIEAIDQDGKRHRAPKGTPLPDGWKLAGGA